MNNRTTKLFNLFTSFILLDSVDPPISIDYIIDYFPTCYTIFVHCCECSTKQNIINLIESAFDNCDTYYGGCERTDSGLVYEFTLNYC